MAFVNPYFMTSSADCGEQIISLFLLIDDLLKQVAVSCFAGNSYSTLMFVYCFAQVGHKHIQKQNAIIKKNKKNCADC